MSLVPSLNGLCREVSPGTSVGGLAVGWPTQPRQVNASEDRLHCLAGMSSMQSHHNPA